MNNSWIKILLTISTLLLTSLLGANSAYSADYTTTLNLTPESSPLVRQVIYRWSTDVTSGGVGTNNLTNLSMELRGGEFEYFDQIIQDGIARPFGGVTRELTDIFWDYNLNTLTLSQFSNGNLGTLTTGQHFQVSDSIALPVDGIVSITEFQNGDPISGIGAVLIDQTTYALSTLDSIFGEDTLTLDTKTDLKWLDVPLASSFSYDTLLPELAQYGSFSKYRLATEDEVIELWDNAGIITSTTNLLARNFKPVQQLMDLVGITAENVETEGSPYDYTTGLYVPGEVTFVATIEAYPFREPQAGRISFNDISSDDNDSTIGAWLIFDPEVWTGFGNTFEGPATITNVVEVGSDVSSDSHQAIFSYDNPILEDILDPGAAGQWYFETNAKKAGTVELRYLFEGFHSIDAAIVKLEYYVRGFGQEVRTFTTLLEAGAESECCSIPPGGFFYSGTVTLPNLQVGDLYGFRISGSNGDENPTLTGTFTVHPEPLYLANPLDDITLDADDPITPVYLTETFSRQQDVVLSVVGNTNPLLFDSLILDDGILGLDPASGQSGSSVITVRAVDGFGDIVEVSFTVTVEAPELFGEAVLVQVVAAPNRDDIPGNFTAIVLRATGLPGATTQSVELLTSASCIDGVLGEDAVVFAEFDIGEFNANGEAFLTTIIETPIPASTYIIARIVGSTSTSEPSACIVAGADNDSWLRALALELENEGDSAFANINGFLDSPGKSRWYKFPIQPGARASVELSSLPGDYDLFIFKDIGQAYKSLQGNNDVNGLNRLSAEFAPSVFSPSVFSPSVFSPSVFSPDAYAPSVFSPSVFSPSVFSPSVFSPSVFSPSVFSPSVFSPSVFSPSVFSPSVFSPSVFSPSVFSPSVFSGEHFASAQMRALLSVSAQEGTGSEAVVADTWNNTGFFYVRVSGKNGASDVETPFRLSVSVDGTNCIGVVPIDGDSNATAGEYESIILWDSGRITADPSNSPSDITALRSRLAQLAARAEVKGVLVDLNDFDHIQALHDQSDEFDSCPYAENLTAQAIKNVIDAHRQMNPNLAYVVLAGSDSHVPFFRYPDQGLLGPEQDYDPPVANGTQSQSALRLNYILGQDQYGASSILSLRDGVFPLPDLAVGRLVETAAEMNTMLDAYLSTANGVIDQPASTLVTGYDFLTDAADEVQFELVAGTSGARNDTLITAAHISPDDPLSWTADDLRRELIENDEGEDIVFLAGHFSANSTLAADYKTTALTTELFDADVDFTNSIVFSAGCHSGYNIVNDDAVPGVTLTLDWTQAFAQKGATLIAGTGYQYGDTDFVEYSERLYVSFARELRTGLGPVSVGQALVRAKQKYLSTTPDVRGLHRKSVLISTVFGLPMLKVDLAGDRIVEPDPPPAIEPVLAAANPGAELGLRIADLTFEFSNDADGELVDTTKQLANLEGGTLTATYLRGPSGIVTNPAEPALPLISRNVSVTGQSLSLRGVGLRGGTWNERYVLPLTGAPTTELRGVHTPFTSPVNFPMRLATSNYFGALTGGGGTILHVTPAQHRVDSVGDFNAVLRQFDDMSFRLYYSDNTQTYAANVPALSGPPSLSGVQAVIDGSDIVFFVRVVGDPAAGIHSVWVTYTEGSGNSGTWVSLDLEQDTKDSTLWSGRLLDEASSFTRLDYIVQAVNGAGLVTMSDNFGGYFHLAGNLGEVGSDGKPEARLETELQLSGPSYAAYGETVNFEATLSSGDNTMSGASVLFTIGNTGRAAKTNASGLASVALPINALPKNYKLTASFGGDDTHAASSAEQDFEIIITGTNLAMQSEAQSVGVEGIKSGLSVLLSDDAGTPLLQRTVYFTIEGGPQGTLTVPAITDNIGRARLGSLALPAGNYDVTARFLGVIPTGVTPLELKDSVYEASSASTVLELEGGVDCPKPVVTNNRRKTRSDRRKLDMTGFCYLTGDLDRKITIVDGTLIVGDDVSVRKAIVQSGAGSVRVMQGGFVKGKIDESGPGSIIVAGRVGAKLQESGPGRIEIAVTGHINGKVDEQDDGNLTVHGVVNNKVTEKGKGDLLVLPTGVITRSAMEYGIGSLINDGLIRGKSKQQN